MADTIDYEAQFKHVPESVVDDVDKEYDRSRTYMDAKRAFQYAKRREAQGHDVAFAYCDTHGYYIVWTNDRNGTPTKEQRISSLPKWAQDEIARLNGDLSYMRNQLKGIEEGGTGITWSKDYEHRQNLPEGARVRFENGDRKVEFYMDNEDELVAMGEGTLCIVPVSSNMFRIRGAKW